MAIGNSHWWEGLKAFAQRWRRPFNWLFTIGILGFVFWQLRSLGLRDVLESLPHQPAFYLIFIVQFAATPVTEYFIFRTAWPDYRPPTAMALLRKRTLNAVVLGYSGDVWFFLWVRDKLGVPAGKAASALKDSSILSGVASGGSTALLAAWLVLSGGGAKLGAAISGHWQALIVVIVLAVFLIPIGIRLRHRIFGLDGKRLSAVFGWHMARILATQLLQVYQWTIVMPNVGFETWLTYITIQLVIFQIPLIPNRDLLFLAVGIQLTQSAGVDQAALAALLLATSAYKQVVNLLFLAITSLYQGNVEMTEGSVLPSDEQRQTGDKS